MIFTISLSLTIVELFLILHLLYPVDSSHPGVCPNTGTGIGICVSMCSGDGGCPQTQKCCSNGCGHTCQDAIIGMGGGGQSLGEGSGAESL